MLHLLKLLPIRHPEKIAKRNLIFRINKSRAVFWKDTESEVNELRVSIKRTVLK